MITDYMIESLIILRWKLCLKMDDLIFFSSNQRSKLDSSFEIRDFEKDQILANQIRNWNLADWTLFEAANKTLWSLVDQFGHDKMEQEKNEFARRYEAWYKYCIADVQEGK